MKTNKTIIAKSVKVKHGRRRHITFTFPNEIKGKKIKRMKQQVLVTTYLWLIMIIHENVKCHDFISCVSCVLGSR